MYDVAIIETGNGGDIQVVGNDISVVNGIENMPYLLSFGGNPGYTTKSKITEEESFDYWGNDLFHRENPSVQFNSIAEQRLKEVSLSSSGRIEIENAFKKDLSLLSSIAEISVVAIIESDDRLKITIKISQKSGSSMVKIVNFRKKLDGDFVFADFNDDFLVG